MIKLIKIANLHGTSVAFRIFRQDHRRKNFYKGNQFYKASNGVMLESACCPEWNSTRNIFYVWGDWKEKDNIVITASIKEYKLISDAVNEYNATFGTDDIRGLFEL